MHWHVGRLGKCPDPLACLRIWLDQEPMLWSFLCQYTSRSRLSERTCGSCYVSANSTADGETDSNRVDYPSYYSLAFFGVLAVDCRTMSIVPSFWLYIYHWYFRPILCAASPFFLYLYRPARPSGTFDSSRLFSLSFIHNATPHYLSSR